MTTPAVTVLRKGLPSARISYVVETPYRELIEGNPDIDEVIVLPRPMSVINFWKAVRQFRKERYDAVIDLHGGPTAALLTFCSGAERRIGYKIKYKSFIYDIKLPRGCKTRNMHSVENHINLIKALGIEATSPPSLSLPEPLESEKRKVQDFFDSNIPDGYRVVVFHIGAGNEFREWGISNWIKLTSLLLNKHHVKIVLVGSSEDAGTAGQILERHPSSVFSLVGKLNLRELKELIEGSSLYVGPDSGPMHIAASTSTQIIAYFGPNLSAFNAPWQAKAVIIEKNLECRPCDQRTCYPGDFRCVRTITPEEIYAACVPFL